MSLISLTGVSKDFGIRNLFKDLTLHINPKERLGLIGPNGAGKSTLLKILAGCEPIDKGQRYSSPKLRIEMVGQDIVLENNKTILEQVLEGCGEKKELLLRFNKLSNSVAQNPQDKKLLNELGQLSERMDVAHAWSLEQQCKEVLHRLGIEDINLSIQELSGGYRKRVCLASSLVANPDVLLLDEPTNHLDASAVEWLQSWLENFSGALIIITHDRYLLDRITHKMVEVNQGESITYFGNYSIFLEEKAKKEKSEVSSAKKFRGALRKELAWLRQGPKARSTKQRARIKRIEEMKNKTIKNNIDSLEINSLSRRIGKIVIQAEELCFSPDQSEGSLLFKDFSYNFSPEDRVGIIGPNGSGKSTLLDLIAGKRKPLSGKIKVGETVHIGYLDQHTDALSSGEGLNRKVLEFIEEAALRIDFKKEQVSASQLLERFLFPPAQQHSPISKLSGGEKRRLTLCRMLIQCPNVLLLDEPTNDLDVQTLSVLEDFLEDFRGCIVVASHDRYFLDRIVDRIFSFEEGKLNRFEGNYSSFLNKKCMNDSNKTKFLNKLELKVNEKSFDCIPDLTTSTEGIRINNQPKRRTFKETKELEELSKNLPILEKKRAELEELLAKEKKDLTHLSKELAEIFEAIKTAEDRWLELSELAP